MRKHLSFLLAALLIGVVPQVSLAKDEATNKPSFSGVVWASYWHAVSGGSYNPDSLKAHPDTVRIANRGTLNAFEIKRAYLNAAGDQGDDWSYRLTYEFAGTGADKGMNAFAKIALIKWSFAKETKQSLTFGLQPTLIWGLSESYWGYRVVMNAPREAFSKSMVAAVRGLSTGSAADLGIAYGIRPISMLGLAAQVSNGSGHKAAEANMFKKIAATATVYPIPGNESAVVEFYYDTEAGYDKATNKDKVSRNSLGLFGGFKAKVFTVGLDYYQKNFADKDMVVSSSTYDVTSSVLSIFGNYSLTDKLKLLGRLDTYTPVTEEKYLNGAFGGKSDESLIIVGADCSYGPPNTHFILTYQQSAFEAKVMDSANNWVDRDAYSAVVLDVAVSF